MTNLRHAVILAICALLSMPLGAAGLEFQADFEQFSSEQRLESNEATISLRETPIPQTSAVFNASAALQTFSGGVSGMLTNRPFETSFIQILPPLADADVQAFRTPSFRRGARARARLIRFHARTSGLPAVPEPTTAFLMAIGLVGLAVASRQHDT